MVFIDSDLIIKYMQKKRASINLKAKTFLEDLWMSEEIISITSYNYAELIRGAYLSSNVNQNLQKVKDICSKFQIIYSNYESLQLYAQISASLRLKGEIIGDIDQLIASIVITSKDRLITHNLEHFRRIPSLQIQNWA